MMTREECAEAVPAVRRAWEEAGRSQPVISLMTSCIIGSDEVDLLERAHATAEIRGDDAEDPEAYLREERPNSLVGTVAQIREQLAELEKVGVERVMLQYLTHRDLDGVGYIAELAES
jgi:alkanesulfonate monooxygenase SsuD/methylene tetrahydromethanopterin reductase-like flavin-dependent oxidoreductase (luciferase family)